VRVPADASVAGEAGRCWAASHAENAGEKPHRESRSGLMPTAMLLLTRSNIGYIERK